jgi:thiol:disulfide interchange protein DsbD
MERVKQVFGVLLLAVAVYLLGNVQAVPVLLLWAALFIVTGVYMGATQALPAGSSGWRYLWKGLGTILLTWGVLAMIGGFAGQRDIMNPVPLRSFGAAATGASAGPSSPAAGDQLFRHVDSLAGLDAAIADAGAANRLVMLDYYADWCVDCIRMENATFRDPRVKAILDRRFELLQVDVTDPNDAAGRAIKRRYSVFGPPAILFIDPANAAEPLARLYGFRSPDEFIGILNAIRPL